MNVSPTAAQSWRTTLTRPLLSPGGSCSVATLQWRRVRHRVSWFTFRCSDVSEKLITDCRREQRMSELQETDPWSFVILPSDLQCSFRAPDKNPSYRDVVAKYAAWLESLARALAPDSANSTSAQDYVNYTLDCELGLVCSMTYPSTTPPDRLLLLTKLVIFMTLLDDAVDGPTSLGFGADACRERHAAFHSILSGKSPHTSHNQYWVCHMAELWQEVCCSEKCTDGFHKRFAAAFTESMKANDMQAAFRQARRLPPDIAEFLKYRRPASLFMPCFGLLEFSLGIHIDDSTYAHPLVRQLHEAMTDYCILVNDILSFRVEMCKQDYYNFPCFLFFSKDDSTYTFKDAVQETLVMLSTADNRCRRLVAEVTACKELVERKPWLVEYSEALGSWGAGFLQWCLITPRYRVPL